MNIFRQDYIKSIRVRQLDDWLQLQNFGRHWRILRQGQLVQVQQITEAEAEIVGRQYVDCYALYGLVRIGREAVYLGVITEVEEIGKVLEHCVRRVRGVRLVPIKKSEKSDAVGRIERWLSGGHLLFSTTLDLSRNLGGRAPRQQYIFNTQRIEKLADLFQPCISGAFHSLTFTLSQKQAQFFIISRRDRRRVGFRWQSRGTDKEGNPSNMIETQFALVRQNTISSYIQVRGSVPVPWCQNPDMSFRPTQQLMYSQDICKKCFNLHIDRLIAQYGNVTILSLLTKSGKQGRLDTQLQTLSQHYSSEAGNLDFISYNYNKQTKNKYYCLSLLLASLIHILKSYNFNQFTTNLTQITKQNGVIRTNCIDCIDRTGIVQFTIMKVMLHAMFNNGDIRPQLFNQPLPYMIEEPIRKMWIEHNDRLALDYTGTAAMKRQIILVGKPTLTTHFRDAGIFFKRYWRGNFVDPQEQLAVDAVMLPQERVLPDNYSLNTGNCFILSVSCSITQLIFVPLFVNWLHVDGKDVGLSGFINIQAYPRLTLLCASIVGVLAGARVLVPWLNRIRRRSSFPFRFK